ncbi:MAG: molybdopterin molybdotransferase MoeA [Planctomycetota bacterium]
MPADPLDPAVAIARLCERVEQVEAEPISAAQPDKLGGRVLAEVLVLDRDSPACDVSAMDGFAVRLSELQAGSVPVVGECRIGEPPVELASGTARRIYTGSPVAAGADAVVRLEWVDESADRIELNRRGEPAIGGDIRRRGENAKAGDTVLSPGIELTTAAISAVATVGPSAVSLRRRLRVGVITTGNELDVEPHASPKPWRLRDSNGPVLEALLSPITWIEHVERLHVGDSLDNLATTIEASLSSCDALLLTGGVSKGAYDHVPDAVRRAGGEVVFHRLKARPGQPTLGAVAYGKPILGLPGNPLAVLCAGRRVALPALRRRAGFGVFDPPAPQVQVETWQGKTIPLTWWRPVSFKSSRTARIASLRGSGDVCGPAETDGFVEVPPDENGTGPFPYYAWNA